MIQRFFIACACLLVSAACAQSYGPRAFDGRTMTALVTAFDPEVDAVLAYLKASPDAELEEVKSFHGVRYYLGTYRGEPIIVFATGISITNAAMTTQMALDYFPIERVLFMGIAGGINPQWKPGDVVVPQYWYYHDENLYANPDPDHPGEYIIPPHQAAYYAGMPERISADPLMPHYRNDGMIFSREVAIVKDGQPEPKLTPYFTVAPELYAAAQDAVAGMELPKLGQRTVKLQVGGRGVSGSVFLDNRDYREWVWEVYQAEVTDMESAAVGQVCTVNGVDWIVIRAVSDLAGGQHKQNELDLYSVPASRFGTQLLFAVLDELTEAGQ
ncbi:5'-methylthioadenosine/S-adenosylhomocysteine nucleosidase [Ruficoccus sp. ZRK36]|uniref:5'-methylthioadenosine/S-adenosylhomocysteine nucleosidase family protein n=1 Tax=Ruficoccus sp. ZRK36 TaxID=2866311 RepID=UPI001C730CE7|nr:5'-methylthioadenosine/S-adenosylhomocysteine nucleosidase [Ruficoccus sp. ZRK36]QYY37116.1 5'-methylthioadenosine/S-adenosylhomocysteine nucleosidase [Ruficoccus sp. ZRK36]